MGEIAEAYLDGTFCMGCGEYLGEGDGFPRTCPACEPASDIEPVASIFPRTLAQIDAAMRETMRVTKPRRRRSSGRYSGKRGHP